MIINHLFHLANNHHDSNNTVTNHDDYSIWVYTTYEITIISASYSTTLKPFYNY